jgi:hypothetical protein
MTIDVAVPILDDHQRIVIGAIKVYYRFDTLFGMINQIRIGQTGPRCCSAPMVSTHLSDSSPSGPSHSCAPHDQRSS